MGRYNLRNESNSEENVVDKSKTQKLKQEPRRRSVVLNKSVAKMKALRVNDKKVLRSGQVSKIVTTVNKTPTEKSKRCDKIPSSNRAEGEKGLKSNDLSSDKGKMENSQDQKLVKNRKVNKRELIVSITLEPKNTDSYNQSNKQDTKSQQVENGIQKQKMGRYHLKKDSNSEENVVNKRNTQKIKEPLRRSVALNKSVDEMTSLRVNDKRILRSGQESKNVSARNKTPAEKSKRSDKIQSSKIAKGGKGHKANDLSSDMENIQDQKLVKNRKVNKRELVVNITLEPKNTDSYIQSNKPDTKSKQVENGIQNQNEPKTKQSKNTRKKVPKPELTMNEVEEEKESLPQHKVVRGSQTKISTSKIDQTTTKLKHNEKPSKEEVNMEKKILRSKNRVKITTLEEDEGNLSLKKDLTKKVKFHENQNREGNIKLKKKSRQTKPVKRNTLEIHKDSNISPRTEEKQKQNVKKMIGGTKLNPISEESINEIDKKLPIYNKEVLSTNVANNSDTYEFDSDSECTKKQKNKKTVTARKQKKKKVKGPFNLYDKNMHVILRKIVQNIGKKTEIVKSGEIKSTTDQIINKNNNDKKKDKHDQKVQIFKDKSLEKTTTGNEIEFFVDTEDNKSEVKSLERKQEDTSVKKLFIPLESNLENQMAKKFKRAAEKENAIMILENRSHSPIKSIITNDSSHCMTYSTPFLEKQFQKHTDLLEPLQLTPIKHTTKHLNILRENTNANKHNYGDTLTLKSPSVQTVANVDRRSIRNCAVVLEKVSIDSLTLCDMNLPNSENINRRKKLSKVVQTLKNTKKNKSYPIFTGTSSNKENQFISDVQMHQHEIEPEWNREQEESDIEDDYEEANNDIEYIQRGPETSKVNDILDNQNLNFHTSDEKNEKSSKEFDKLFGFSSDDSSSCSPSKIQLISNLLIKKAHPTEQLISSQRLFNKNNPKANSTVLLNSASPWRYAPTNITRNPHFLSIKKTGLPSINQEMVLDYKQAQKLPIRHLQPNRNMAQKSILEYVEDTNQVKAVEEAAVKGINDMDEEFGLFEDLFEEQKKVGLKIKVYEKKKPKLARIVEDQNQDEKGLEEPEIPNINLPNKSETPKLYQRKARHVRIPSCNSELDHVEEEQYKQPKKKKRDIKSAAEEEALNTWAEQFNSMCKEVDKYVLEIE